MLTPTPLQRISTNAKTPRQVKVVKNDEGRVTGSAQTAILEVAPTITDDLETLVAEGLFMFVVRSCFPFYAAILMI